jgi:hypothetical protein
MPDQEIKELIEQMMRWDGSGSDPEPGSCNGRPAHQWAWEMWHWGRRVRRDILVLEHHVARLKKGDPKDLFYGDPGDPPPPPPEF